MLRLSSISTSVKSDSRSDRVTEGITLSKENAATESQTLIGAEALETSKSFTATSVKNIVRMKGGKESKAQDAINEESSTESGREASSIYLTACQ